MHLHGTNAPNFRLSFLLCLLCSLRCRRQNCENPCQNHQTKNEKVTKKCTYLWKIMLHFLKFLALGSCFASVQCGRLDLTDILKPMSKCCRRCCRTNVTLLIWVSVVLPFHKCLRLLRLGLYTVSTPRVDNDATIAPHICYISLLRCNYYHECLACEEEDLWTINITWKGLRITVWRALSNFVENCSVIV